MAITIFLHHFHLLKCTHPLPSISHSYLLKCFSTLPNHSNKPHSPNLFADFALNNFNLSHPDIARIFKYKPSLLNLKTLENVEAFVDMFSRHGFTHNQIAQIMKKQPTVIPVSAERVLEPKLQFLKDFGFQVEGLASMVVRMPRILTHSLETTLKPSVAFWEGFGLHRMELLHFLSSYPHLLLFSSLTPAKAQLISKIGIAKDNKMFKYVLRTVVETSMEKLESRIHMFQQCGLASEETMHLLRVAPQVFGLSEEKVWQHMDFVVNNMELPANSVVKLSRLLDCSLDKVLKPRFLVWQKLKSIGGDIKIKSFSTVLFMTEASFVSKILKGHPESAILYAIYQEALADASSTTTNSRKV